ncbi:MAG: cytochrome ubiquinol oxidase subunit I [Proteobacteria bacterium]|nr:cytochrome ubiquinol oxidase subunit I [Pseudomonadota bacterium]
MHNSLAVIDLSRWQFATTALYHFLFVPLTLGLSFLLAAMETAYVTTGKQIYKDMVLFWSKLFAINFALGVATGLTMEFEFGTNWSEYSRFVGDVFGAPLALEGIIAFFLESTFVGLMLFGWDRMSRGKHLLVTYMVALGSNLSALWILIANGFMQSPHGATFNPLTMRLELTSFTQLIFNHDAQAKFVHTSIAGYVTAAVFVAGISGWYMLHNRHMELAKRSFRMAVLYGVFASIGVISLGDALGFIDGSTEPAKIVAMEAQWKTETPPAGFNLIAFPSQKEQRNLFKIQIPMLLTPLVTHTLTQPIPGADEIENQAITRMKEGIPAVEALKTLATDPTNQAAMKQFKAHEQSLGYAFLLQKYAPHLSHATPADFQKAARDVIPDVPIIFWAFRIMVLTGFAMLVYLGVATFFSLNNHIQDKKWLLKLAVWFIPVPYVACETGWIVAEVGRQPWTVYGILPTWMSASNHSLGYMIFSLGGFILLYTIFIIVEMYLMLRFIRQGPTTGHMGHHIPSPLTPEK